MIYDPLIEKMMHHFTKEPFTGEVAQAKQEFFERAGIFDEYSPDFEMKMAQFMDWYLFSRELEMNRVTPVDYAADSDLYPKTDEEKPLYTALRQNRHSLFEYLKIKGEDVFLRDLFSGYKHVIHKSPVTIGFNSDEIFEARLIPFENSYVFAKAFCIHPPQVSKFIIKEIKKIKLLPQDEQKAAREELMIRLFRMRYKHEQYRHVAIDEIYSNNSKLRL